MNSDLLTSRQLQTWRILEYLSLYETNLKYYTDYVLEIRGSLQQMNKETMTLDTYKE
jgi:hypothetical protein